MQKLFVVLGFLWAATASLSAQTVTVAAAANLSALEAPLSRAYEQVHPGQKLQFVFGASGTLVTQILNGAPYQAFLSADRGFAQKVVDAGRARGAVIPYALGRLIFLALDPVDLSAGIASVLDPAVVQFANSNPDLAPYGRAAVEAMTKAGVYDRARSKQVLGQNVTQALQFLLTVTHFGFVNKSALYSAELAPYRQEGKWWIEVDPRLYAPLEQGAVVLKPTSEATARDLTSFLASPAVRQIFVDFGYGVP